MARLSKLTHNVIMPHVVVRLAACLLYSIVKRGTLTFFFPPQSRYPLAIICALAICAIRKGLGLSTYQRVRGCRAFRVAECVWRFCQFSKLDKKQRLIACCIPSVCHTLVFVSVSARTSIIVHRLRSRPWSAPFSLRDLLWMSINNSHDSIVVNNLSCKRVVFAGYCTVHNCLRG